MGEDAVKMYEWFDRVGFAVDRAAQYSVTPKAVYFAAVMKLIVLPTR